MIRRPPRSTHCISSAASDVYKRQVQIQLFLHQRLSYFYFLSFIFYLLLAFSPFFNFFMVPRQQNLWYFIFFFHLSPQPLALYIDPCTLRLSLIHISEPTRLGMISYAVFCLKKKKKT
eukprot:TRINITY_DN14787_c0_g1_i1.p1 TRINITY_DN14787_c0_g1~~TRINITY_DN14787_c0_g1_i1.p1  ORF type:complete len:118 (+),score=20.94 TRINITY_DN14787_c0_g1_i1:83-436(+)